MNNNNIGSSFDQFLKDEGIDLDKEPNKKPQISKLEFFKQTLNEFIKLKNRNDKFNESCNTILENEMTRDFPVYLSDSFCYPYETLILDSLAQLWNEPRIVKDWMEYLIYECLDMKDGRLVHDTKADKKYKITDVDSLCIYLLDYYKIGI